LLLLILAGACGWSQVRFKTVMGQMMAIPPSWTFFASLLTLIFGIAGRGAEVHGMVQRAYGLMLSIIWMYVPILRLLALLRSRQ